MDVNKTGNAFIAYPDSLDNIFKWEYGKQQNLQATTYPTLGLFLDLENYKLDTKSVCIINAVSKPIGEYLSTLKTPDEIIKCYEEAAYNADKKPRNNTEMAEFILGILSKTNSDITYKEGDEVKPITKEELAAALDCMENKMPPDQYNNELKSPNSLYNHWLANASVKETPAK